MLSDQIYAPRRLHQNGPFPIDRLESFLQSKRCASRRGYVAHPLRTGPKLIVHSRTFSAPLPLASIPVVSEPPPQPFPFCPASGSASASPHQNTATLCPTRN